MTAFESQQDQALANRRAAWRWGSFVVALLSLQVAGGVVAILLASGDPSVAVVPDYHQKALHWDDQVALRSAAAKLGWSLQLSQVQSGEGFAGLTIELRDRSGQWVPIHSGTIEIYRHVRAGDVRRTQITDPVTGPLDLPKCFSNSGLWQVSMDVQDARGNRFVDSREVHVVIDRDEPVRGE
ncbi:MAG: FixH family protein [Pirellulales bacterium]|nr:FixH family protein [Pirellulales bacterium]